MLAKDAVKARKWLHEPGARISACFTSLGDRHEKGADLYVRIAELYRSTYPQDNVTFYGIGNVIPAVDMVVFDPSAAGCLLPRRGRHHLQPRAHAVSQRLAPRGGGLVDGAGPVHVGCLQPERAERVQLRVRSHHCDGGVGSVVVRETRFWDSFHLPAKSSGLA